MSDDPRTLLSSKELDEIAAAMADADGLERDNPCFATLWPSYQLTARRYAAAHTKLREIRRRKGRDKLGRSLLGA